MANVPNPQEIMRMMINNGNLLSDKNVELIELARKKSESESAYRIALRVEILKLRASGMSVTLTADLARGDKIVAKMKLERDIAEGVYDACRDRIRGLRSHIEVLRSILTWQRAELGGQ